MSQAGEMEVEAYRRLYPLPYYERHLVESVRPDARPLGRSRETTVGLGPVATADGSALVKIGDTTMLAAIKLEVMTPAADSPDQGSVAIDFHMPPICSPTVRPGRPAEVAPVISKQLSDVVMSSGMVDLKELSLINGKAAWMAYLIPLVSLNDDGRVMAVAGEAEAESKLELVNKEKRRLCIGSIPFSLTCVLHKKYIFADPTAEEESIMDTLVTVVVDLRGRLVSVYKGGAVLAHDSALQECIALAQRRAKELQKILADTFSPQA